MNSYPYLDLIQFPVFICKNTASLDFVFANQKAKEQFAIKEKGTIFDALSMLEKEKQELQTLLQPNIFPVNYVADLQNTDYHLSITLFEKERGYLQVDVNALDAIKEPALKTKNNLDIYHCMASGFHEPIFTVTLDTQIIVYANEAMAKFCNLPLEKLIGITAPQMQLAAGIKPEDYKPPTALLETDGNYRKVRNVWEFYHIPSSTWYLISDIIIPWPTGEYVLMECFTDITTQKNLQASLEHAGSIDNMTKTYNREWCVQLLQKILSNKFSQQKNTIAFIDIDQLKTVNDTFGHIEGDRLITKSVELIKSCIRQSDVLCRWGGDEFVLLIRADEESTEIVMQKIMKKFKKYNAEKKELFSLSFSYGIAELKPNSIQTIESLIELADRRMYAQKQQLKKESDKT